MCELCELKAKADKKTQELMFRFAQYQVELQAERPKEADAARRRATALLEDVFEILQRHSAKVMSAEFDMEHGSGLASILRGKMPGGGSLN